MTTTPDAGRRGRHLGALLIATGLLLAACSSADGPSGDPTTQSPLPTLPDVTAAETPSSDPSESLTPEQQAEAEAKAAILGYFEASDRVLQDPENYDPLIEAGAVVEGSAMAELTLLRERQLTGNLHTEGFAVVESMTLFRADYTGEELGRPGQEFVTCFNVRDVDYYKDGVLFRDLADAPTEQRIIAVAFNDVEEPAGWRVSYNRPVDEGTPPC